MRFAERFVKTAKWLLPSPFTIAVLLTIAVVLMALLFTDSNSSDAHILEILGHWQNGFWSLLQFTIQMMLILVLGYVLAKSPIIDRFISFALKWCNTTANAALVISFFTILVAFFNWGLGLIFGAIFARKIAEKAQAQQIKLNYPLIGACGYSGLMVWHGGLSGSAPVTVAGPDHNLISEIGVIPLNETVFSGMNIAVSLALLFFIPILVYWLGKKSKHTEIPKVINVAKTINKSHQPEGAEKLDHSFWLAILVSIAMLITAAWSVYKSGKGLLGSLNLNFINFNLFALCLLFHGSFSKFIAAFEEAIGSSAGILMQFPLYAGIIGIMKGSGLIAVFSAFFVDISTATTFPIFTFISAAIVNIFVPSGGGQWVVQGPIIVDAANNLNLSYAKCIMALAYGDQLTNMLQPFWALPLLGITGLKAKEILPYTLILFLAGTFIFMCGILLF